MKSTSLVPKLLVVLTALCPLIGQAAATDYDGTWNATATCSAIASSGQPGFASKFKLAVLDGRIKEVIKQRDKLGEVETAWEGKVEGGAIKLTGSGRRKDTTWTWELTGKASGKKTISTSGSMSARNVKIRDCTLEMESVAPATSSLAAMETKPATIRPTTVASEPIPATQTLPARPAAIGNVRAPVQAAVGQTVPGQPTQLTTNPIDLQKKTSSNEMWVSFNPSITVQERQFCRIVENFRTANAVALGTRNQIKVNETFKSLVQSLNALLPDGKFQGWIMKTVYVSQASDGSAEVLLELPCNVYVGSNACDANPQNFYGTAPENSRIYTELAKMTVGDFALTSGQFVYTDSKAFDKNRSVASFKYLRTAAHCRAKEMPADTEFFGLKLDVISTIK